jgi:hypothetical protein
MEMTTKLFSKWFKKESTILMEMSGRKFLRKPKTSSKNLSQSLKKG